jgi:hypothetical protein
MLSIFTSSVTPIQQLLFRQDMPYSLTMSHQIFMNRRIILETYNLNNGRGQSAGLEDAVDLQGVRGELLGVG